MSPYTLHWPSIRPIDGSREKGFEELCAQLARSECPAEARFERKGTPDAGVECFAVFPDGSEWGWQSKYFDDLGDSQWKQIDKSVETALEKHTRLARYFVCVPLDRPDARIKRQKSAMEKWKDHVEKWQGWAQDKGMDVEFVWWGSSELLERLVQPQNVGRTWFWFNARGFDSSWFQSRLDAAQRTAGPRYTPEIHVELPITNELEAFGRTRGFFDHVKSTAKGIRKAFKHYGYSKGKAGHSSLDYSVPLFSWTGNKEPRRMNPRRQGESRREAVGRPERVTLAGRLQRDQVLLQENPHVPNTPRPRRGYPTMDSQKEGRRRPGPDPGYEYDAVQTFFTYYELELPSTPLLAPEFSNPLFLKTLCKGLKAKGETRLPRGFQGITAAFDLYANAINDILAKSDRLDFHKKQKLAIQAIQAFALELQKANQRWLPFGKAMQVINDWLPGRSSFEGSLYQGLLSEGLLVEEVAWLADGTSEEATFIAYDRMADHLIAKAMLDSYLDPKSPASCFGDDGPFAFLWDDFRYANEGLLEALCIQVPERVGHLLLRDFARGVVERALYLRSSMDIEDSRIRPPYRSRWPEIPTEEEIQALKPDWSKGAWAGGDLEWSRNRIFSSVMDDDFARYVIGTNSGSTDWLSLRLDEPPWKSTEEKIEEILERFSRKERAAWDRVETLRSELDQIDFSLMFFPKTISSLGSIDSEEDVPISDEMEGDSRREQIENKLYRAILLLGSVLTQDHAEELSKAIFDRSDPEKRNAPKFDLRLIQRYVLKRVFELGWTVERFGAFDRNEIGYHGREASKAERIGKKYQWIAYHEIQALIADHFQFRESYIGDAGKHVYTGPWQDSFRDIDPSFTRDPVRLSGDARSGEGHAWWDTAKFDRWGAPERPREWALRKGDLPKIENLLLVTHPRDGSRWLNVQGDFHWRQGPPPELESMDAQLRELWMMCTGYLVPATDVDTFLKWAKTVNFWGRWMPNPREFHHMFLGEFGWSPAFRDLFPDDLGGPWIRPRESCPATIRLIGCSYFSESSGFDCSIDESQRLQLPVGDLLDRLGLKWAGKDAEFIDAGGRVGAFDPSATCNGPEVLLIREDLIRSFLDREGLALCWAVLGEKQYLAPGWDSGCERHELQLSGAYVLRGRGPEGFMTFHRDRYP